jgi:hypothetical protein
LPQFQAVIRVGPPHLFGLPNPAVQALPANTAPVIKWEPDLSRVWAETPDGSDPYRKYEERFTFKVTIGSVEVDAEDDLFRVTLEASDEEEAGSRAAQLVLQLFHLQATVFLPGVHRITATIVAVGQYDGKTVRLTPGTTGVYLYDLQQLGATLLEAADMLKNAVGDMRLAQAVRYFGLGDDLSELLTRSTALDYGASLAPIRFLQYWKSLATIVGDPSSDKDYQSRHVGLGLGRQYFRHEINPLHTIRNQFGVAHIADPNAPRIVTQANVQKCREVAATVIHAYVRGLKKSRPR